MSFQLQLRSTVSTSSKQLRVDVHNARIYGANAMTAGVEALGHRLETDQITIERLAALAHEREAAGKQIRTRFGHPGISENAMGKQLGYTTNYRVEGNKLLYDLQMLDSARKSPSFAQDPVAYVLDMALKTPEHIGTSVVIETEAVWKLQDGTEVQAYDSDGDRVKRPENAVNKHPLMRPAVFHYTDIVQEGAVTHDGMFGSKIGDKANTKLFASGASSYAEELFRLVDEWRTAYNIGLSDVPQKTLQLLKAYLHARGGKMDPKEGEPEEVLTPVSVAPDTLAQLEANAAQLAGTNEAEGPEDGSTAALSQLWMRLEGLEEQVQRLTQVLDTVVKANLGLQAQVRSLVGEPHQTLRVPSSPQRLNTLLTALPANAQDASQQSPASGKPAPVEVDPQVLAAQKQLSRNQRQGYGKR